MQVHKDNAPEMIQKEIESIIKSGLKDEEDYTTLQNLYSIAKLPEQSKLIENLKEEKFPHGKWQINEAVNNFLREKDLNKKEAMLDNISDKIKNDSSWKYLEPSLSYFKSSLINSYYQKQDWQGMEDAIKKYDVQGMDAGFNI